MAQERGRRSGPQGKEEEEWQKQELNPQSVVDVEVMEEQEAESEFVPHVHVDDFDYELPSERIAVRPCNPRDHSRLLLCVGQELLPRFPNLPPSSLLVGDGSQVFDLQFIDVPDLLPSNSLLLLNDSKVIAARIPCSKKDTGGKSEVFLLSPLMPSRDPPEALRARSGEAVWKAMIRGRRIDVGDLLVSQSMGTDGSSCAQVRVEAEVLERDGADAVVRLSWTRAGSADPEQQEQQEDLGAPLLHEVLKQVGRVPLPPYIKREADREDLVTYQTSHAQHEGSVAAPTAGLHFSERVMQRLLDKGTESLPVTLHVGAGTFKPVEANDVAEHEMHHERIIVNVSTLKGIMQVSSSRS
eukprot:759727-Hanusia_phi.AAC.2